MADSGKSTQSAVIGFADYRGQAEALAAALGLPCLMAEIHRFPDGESLLRLPTGLPSHLIVCRSLDRPNDKLVELLLLARTAREQGLGRLSLIAPYLAYMRQDIAFHPGEAVSQRIIGTWLAGLFDDVITVDPHLHRITHLDEAVPARHARALSSTEAMGRFLATRTRRPFLLGPDSESTQWVEALAAPAGLDWAVAEKIRHGDCTVSVQLPAADFAGREVILVDDVLSTGHTVAEAARALLAAGADTVQCLVTHALFAPEAEAVLHAAGIDQVWSSDSITHPSNTVALAGLLADAVRALPTLMPATSRPESEDR